MMFFIYWVSLLFSQTSDDVVVGADCINEVYYSLKDGTLKTSPRDSWDIDLIVLPMGASVLVNSGSGIMLYTYPNGPLDDWDTIDTATLSIQFINKESIHFSFFNFTVVQKSKWGITIV